jgi:dTDP-4-amino-4,6-dideoxy-D-galactose acyltransferase
MQRRLTYAGMRLVEMRVIHHLHPLTTNTESSWKLAVPDDKLNLGEVAARMRNPFDRMHADLLVSDNVADEYLRTYAMACVNGFTDAVIIPNESGVPSNSFIAINLRKDDWSWHSMSYLPSVEGYS